MVRFSSREEGHDVSARQGGERGSQSYSMYFAAGLERWAYARHSLCPSELSCQKLIGSVIIVRHAPFQEEMAHMVSDPESAMAYTIVP